MGLSEDLMTKKDKDLAYLERNLLVRFLTSIYPSHLARHPDADINWENDWRWIVCIHTMQGQLSWHIHDSERKYFDHLEIKPNDWDGHSTLEKYLRLDQLAHEEDAEK